MPTIEFCEIAIRKDGDCHKTCGFDVNDTALKYAELIQPSIEFSRYERDGEAVVYLDVINDQAFLSVVSDGFSSRLSVEETFVT
ncbi:SGNH/GDSL hydrolase family protein [bacterium]|nr:SGNH/GDSL hydrolase family protein [bacterium]